jgi:protein SCO1/2
VYHLEGRWQDQDGQEVSLASFRGKPQVLAVIYARCKGACPRIIREIQSMEDLLRTAHPQGVGYLLVTMDPEVDTPERLKALAQEYGLGPDWRLLRGSQDQVRELAAVLGVKFRKVSETDFAHSNTITILDAEGVVAYQKQELGTGVQGSAQAVTDLLAEPSPCCAETP